MKRLIVIPAIGNLDYAAPCIDAWGAYAERHGADLDVMDAFPEKAQYGHVMFAPVEVVRRYRDSVDSLLIVDADTMPTPQAASIFDQIPTAEALGVPDINWPTVGHVRNNRQKRVLLEAVEDMGITVNGQFPPEAPYFNAGVVLWRRPALQKITLDGKMPSKFPWDQDWMNARFGADGIKVGQLGHEWNCMTPKINAPGTGSNIQIYHFYGWRKQLIYRFHYDLHRG